jgi:hypothetical protein
MVTTNRMIPIDAFRREPKGLIHLTGSFQVLARVVIGDADGVPAHVELFFDAGQVRGVGLETGTRYHARGAYRFTHDAKEFPSQLDLVSTFELLGYGRGNPEPIRLLLVVPFHVMVPADGRITTRIDDPKLLPCPYGE